MIEKYEEALEVSNKVIAMNPNNQSVLSVAYSNKGYALVWLKKPKKPWKHVTNLLSFPATILTHT